MLLFDRGFHELVGDPRDIFEADGGKFGFAQLLGEVPGEDAFVVLDRPGLECRVLLFLKDLQSL